MDRSDLDIGQGHIALDFNHVHFVEGWVAVGIVKEVLAIGINLEAISATANGQLQGKRGCEAGAGRRLCEAGGRWTEGQWKGEPRLTSKYCPWPNGLWPIFLSSVPHEPFSKLFRTTVPSSMRGLMCRATSPEEPTLKLIVNLGEDRVGK